MRTGPSTPRVRSPDHFPADRLRPTTQLAATLALFKREQGTLRALKGKGVTKVGAVLLYIDDAGSQKFELPTWWARRGEKILDAIG